MSLVVLTFRYHLFSYIPLVKVARKYFIHILTDSRFFSQDADLEIVNEIRPYLCPHDITALNHLTLLSLFLPVRGDSTFNFVAAIPEFLAVWSWIEDSPSWDKLWFS